jgi:hypothetical protein
VIPVTAALHHHASASMLSAPNGEFVLTRIQEQVYDLPARTNAGDESACTDDGAGAPLVQDRSPSSIGRVDSPADMGSVASRVSDPFRCRTFPHRL